MTINDLKEVAAYLSDKFQYIEVPISDKVIALGIDNTGARVIVALSEEPETIDVAFSPIALPSEVASVMYELQEEFMYDIRVTKDFYLAKDKEMYLGMDAMTKFAEDLHQMVEDAKFQAECEKDGSPLLDESVYVVKEPIYPATPKDLKKKQFRKYSKL